MSLISDLQSIGKFLQKEGNIKLYEKILAAQERTLEMMEEINNLTQEVEKLEKKLKIKGSIKFDKDVYWIKDKTGAIKEGPFCPKCYDDEGLLIHLIGSEMNSSIKRCPKCKFVKQKLIKEFRPDSSRERRSR